MPDAKYDAIIVGGGHHATIIACYLARAGLKTAMFERWHECGGGACGEELPLPGYIQNVCAHFTRFYTHPAYDDFQLRDFGLVYKFPEYNEAWLFPDDKYIIGKAIYNVTDPMTGKGEFNQKNAQDLVDQIRNINVDDAGTAEVILESFQNGWRDVFGQYRYTGPDEWGTGPDPLEALSQKSKWGIDPKYGHMTIGEIAVEMFKSPELQTFYMRAHQTSNGLMPCDKPGLYWHIHVLGLVLSVETAAIVIGGTHSITHALLRAGQQEGAEFYVLNEVKQVLVENGKASGVLLKNGDTIKADIVISDLNIEQTLAMIGEQNVPDSLWEKSQKLPEDPKDLDATGYERTQIFWGNVALMEDPVYNLDPNLGMVPRLYMGKADPEYFLSGRYQKERWDNAIASQLYMLVAPDVQWDPTRAPATKFAALVEEFTCPWRNFTEREWMQKKREIAKRFIEEWGKYAPNVNQENFIEAFITTPDDVINRNPTMSQGGWGALDADASRLGRLRPFPEISNYRMPVDNYYLCSSAAHSAHGIGRGSGYNCYKAIAKDLDLNYRPWEARGI